MLKIKLFPTGRKHQRQFRIAVAEEHSKLTGHFVDILGHYHPNQKTNKLVLDKALLAAWVKKGAQPTASVRNLAKK